MVPQIVVNVQSGCERARPYALIIDVDLGYIFGRIWWFLAAKLAPSRL
jgi:hypothetical protein